MNKKTLNQFYAEHAGKVSDKWSLYLTEYDRLFEPYRDRPVRMLEIGIQNGGSLEIWSEYFSRAETLVGCDINPLCLNLVYDDPRVKVVVGDANEPATFARVSERSADFDIIIDDGSHLSSDIIKSFALYFPRLVEGGIFVIEDLHCSYWDRFEGGLYDPYSSLAFFKRLTDIINFEHWGVEKPPIDIVRGILAKYQCDIPAELFAQVHSVEFINSMCVVRKAPAENNGLGRRVIAGRVEIAAEGHHELHGLPYELDPMFNQSSNPWSNRKTPPDEAIPAVERSLIDTQAHVNLLNQQNAALNDKTTSLKDEAGELVKRISLLSNELNALRSSTSWRVTAPLRFAVESVTGRRGKAKAAGAPRGQIAEQTATANAAPLRARFVQRAHAFYRSHLKSTRLGRRLGEELLRRGVISPAELRYNEFAYSSTVVEEGKPFTEARQVEADSRVPGFHMSLPLNVEVSDELSARSRINVLIPSLRLKHMSGGPNTALVLAALLAENGEYVRLVATDASAEGEEAALYPHMEVLMQRPVARERIELVDACERKKPFHIGVNDLFFATAWWTAQIAKYAVLKTVQKTFIYLIQDFEPILHEGSTFQARALETYGLSHVPVINTELLKDHLVRESAGLYADRGFSNSALWFEPALDRAHYFPDRGSFTDSSKKVLLFYGRPTVARRNLFELGVVALRQAVASGAIDKDNWEVWAMGEKIAPVSLGNGVFLNPLPWMSFDTYAKRVRTSDVLLSLMLSPHPSYPPLEMAASGKLVVTNSFSVKTVKRLHAISPNIIVAEPTAESVARALESAVGRINVGLQSFEPSGKVTLPSSWDESFKPVVPALLERIRGLRTVSADDSGRCAPGLPSTPKTEYEHYRRERLTWRRHEATRRQVPGLLSFVTSAYNTAPGFLEDLGNSVFLQDGGMKFEWFILDNGSTSGETRQALEQLGQRGGVRLERVEQNLGIIGGMRYCLERARGRYILPLDSDDLIEPDCVQVLTRYIEDNNYPPLLYTDEDKLSVGGFSAPYFKSGWDPVLFLHSCYIAHLCAIDREAGLQLGLYTDATAEGCHDWDSFIRFMNAGHIPLHVPEVLYSWRMHEASTSGNIASKSYITDSHRATLQRALNHRHAPNLELVYSPHFQYNVDWWYRRNRGQPVSSISVVLVDPTAGPERSPVPALESSARVRTDEDIGQLAHVLAEGNSELVHICWDGVSPDDDEWLWDAAGLLEMFPDAVMVGGTLHDGTKVVDGPRIFGFGDGFDCPDRGRPLSDPGYSAMMWKARSVSAVSSGHCVIKRDFLVEVMPTLLTEKVALHLLGPWLGALAAQRDRRIVFSPFMRANATIVPEDGAAPEARAAFLSRFWSQCPDVRFYSSRLGLSLQTAYTPVGDAERDRHLAALQTGMLPYADRLNQSLRQRASRYPIPPNVPGISVVTPVYQGSDLELLDALARSIAEQSLPIAEWLLIANGPISEDVISVIRLKAAGEWRARLIEIPQPGIVRALRVGLETAVGAYVIPVDGDDLITSDAIQILAHEIERLDQPDLLYSDEDQLMGGKPAAPYLRAAFDPVLGLDNSVVWHLCAMKREAALNADVYGDEAANWCQDWDSVSRIHGRGGRIEHVPEILYHWRQHAASTTNNAQGDVRSLDSVRHILERHIARSPHPHRFHVAEWPESRGATELYIARRDEHMPPFVSVDEISADGERNFDNAILVITATGVTIESAKVFAEVARLFDLHPGVGAVGGVVENSEGAIVDGCYMINRSGSMESPWLRRAATWGGPYALALKPQSVAATGNALAFFRFADLRSCGAWPPMKTTEGSDLITQLGDQLTQSGRTIAYSPLVRARANLILRAGGSRRWPSVPMEGPSHSLIRYGSSRDYRE